VVVLEGLQQGQEHAVAGQGALCFVLLQLGSCVSRVDDTAAAALVCLLPAAFVVPGFQAVDAAGTHIVVGGEGSQPSIWDLATGSKVWQGKGGKPNRVRLVDKPYPTALAFLPGSGAAAAEPSAANGHSSAAEEGSEPGISRRFVAGSATAKLHVYDTAAGKRPQQEVVFGESRVTALAVEPSGE
jgi:hypothetical protein